jgi:integrase/recombinase XerD
MPAQATLKPVKIEDGLRSKPWMLRIPPYLSETGMRRKIYFATKEEAEKAAQGYKQEKKQQTRVIKNLNEFDARQADAAFRLVETSGFNVSLLEVLRKGLETFGNQSNSVTFKNLVAEFLEKRNDVTSQYLKEIRLYAARFSKLQNRFVCDLSSKDFSDVYSTFNPYPRNAAIRCIRSVLSFGIRQGYLKTNPIYSHEKVKIARKEVRTVPNEVVEKILNDALENDLSFLPYLAFGFFAGIRPEGEMTKLLWSDLDLDDKVLTVRSEISKTKQRRFIEPLSKNLIAWLQAYQNRGGSMEGYIADINKSTVHKRRGAVMERIGGFEWIQDGMRHSFCSNWLAAYKDIGKLRELSGHRSVDILFNHYNRGTRTNDALKFWQIFPPTYQRQEVAAA